MTRAVQHLAVLVGALLLAVLFSWPLPQDPRAQLPGDPTGDTGVYVWNLWAFRHELVEHRHSPFYTDLLFVPKPDRVWLVLHNYTVFADLLALPLQKPLGLIATFNGVLWLGSALNVYAFFLLARYLTRDPLSAALAALAFGFSPFLVTRATAHYSLAIAAALPIFVLMLLKARDARLYRYAVGAGLAAVWAAFCDAYYGVFCGVIAAYVIAEAAIDVSFTPEAERPRARVARRVIDGIAAIVALVIVGLLIFGGGLYTPVLVLTLLLLVRWIVASGLRLSWRRGAGWGQGVRLVAAGVGAVLVLSLPLLYGFANVLREGRYVEPRPLWRTSPPGMDLLAFVLPNPNHAWWGVGRDWLAKLPNGYVENVASQSLVALALIAWAAWRRRDALPRFWVGFAACFVLLSLGPFIRAAGFNTRVPTPWTFLRYLPVVANARSPTRFAVVATLAIAVLFAFALRAWLARSSARWRPAAIVGVLLIAELLPIPRKLFPAEVPRFYERIAQDTRDVALLELPFGVRSGDANVGSFTAFTMFTQTTHGKPLLGGYLSRVGENRIEAYRRDPMANALLQFSSGTVPTTEVLDAAWQVRRTFLEETRLGYVVIDTRRASDRLQRFVVNVLRLVPIDSEGYYDVYVPASNMPPGVER